MNSFNSPAVIKAFQDRIKNIKIYGTPESREPMHAKALMFLAIENTDENILIVGSSNLTYIGLITNTEWNVLVKGNTEILSNTLQKYIYYWKHESFYPDELFFSNYRQRKMQHVEEAAEKTESFSIVKPNEFQVEALHKLYALRKERVTKALVIAATGYFFLHTEEIFWRKVLRHSAPL